MQRPEPRTTEAIIDGRLVAAASGRRMAVVAPAEGRPFAEIPLCGAADLDRAVDAARRAFEDRRWSGQSPKARKQILARWADLVAQEADHLAALEARDIGMPIGMARNLEIANAIDCLHWYAETCDKLYEQMMRLDAATTALIHRVPLGVVGAVLPWNAPAMIGAWKLGPALAAGNCVIVKPSEHGSLVMLRMAELALVAGLPDGVLQALPGEGAELGDAMARHMGIDAITFTGSGRVGRQIMAAAAASNLKRVSLELGGKSANIVLDDAPDLDMAADVQVGFMFDNQGQVCEAPSRLLVHRPIMDSFVEAVRRRAAALKIGDPLDPQTRLGPVISAGHRAGILDHMARADSEGARFVLDGRTARVPDAGFYLGASVAVVDDPGCALAQQEVFGPVLAVIGFDTVDEAISIANGTRFGLGANLWSGSLDTVMHVTDRLVAGNINVNGGAGPVVELPFGGFRESGFGRDRSLHAIGNYSDLKNVIIRSGRG